MGSHLCSLFALRPSWTSLLSRLVVAGTAGLFLLTGCALVESDDPPWDTDIPESEDVDGDAPVWGPEGEHILFTHTLDSTGPNPGRRYQLWKAAPETGEREQVAPGRLTTPDWSPNGEWVVFHTRAQFSHLYKISIDGDSLVALTGPDSPNPNLDATTVGRWSPSGDRILYARSAGEPRGLWMMNPDGTEAEILIPYGVQGDWFPSGERVAYVNWDQDEEDVRRRRQIFVANADGSDPRKITDLPDSDVRFPRVSPDGSQIAFTYGASAEPPELYLMDADGSNIRQVTGGPGHARKPDWHPSGDQIVFSRDHPGEGEYLYLLDTEMLEVEPVFPANDK